MRYLVLLPLLMGCVHRPEPPPSNQDYILRLAERCEEVRIENGYSLELICPKKRKN